MKNEHVRVVKELDGHYTAMQNDMQVAPPLPPTARCSGSDAA